MERLQEKKKSPVKKVQIMCSSDDSPKDPFHVSDDSDQDKNYEVEVNEFSDTDSESDVTSGTSSTPSQTQSQISDTDIPGSKSSLPKVGRLQEYFTYVHDKERKKDKIGICKLCQKTGKNIIIKMRQSNTSGLKKHLLTIHKKEYAKVYPTKAAEKNKPMSSQSHTITKMFAEMPSANSRAITQPEFEQMTVDWIAVKYLPFSFFDDHFTQNFFKCLNNKITYPKRTALRAKAIERYRKMQECVIKIISSNESKVSFTIDEWTSVAGKSFYGITAHYVDQNFKLQSLTIDFVPSNGRHTGKDIANIFMTSIRTYKLETKIQGITVDNAAANTRFMQELSKIMAEEENLIFNVKDQHFRCFAHILNLAVQDLLKIIKDDVKEGQLEEIDEEEQLLEEELSKPLSRLRTLFVKIKRSEQWKQKLKSCCDALNIKVVSVSIDVCTRWNSTSEMLSVAMRLRPVLNALCENNDELRIHKIEEDEWYVFSEVEKILKYFKIFSTSLGGEKYATLPLVIIGFNMLVDKLESQIFALDRKHDRNKVDEEMLLAFQAARDKLLKHYQKTNWIYCVVLVLDPRHKTETFNLTSWGKDLLSESINKFEEIFRTSYFSSLDSSASHSDQQQQQQSGLGIEDNDLDLTSLFATRLPKSVDTWRNEIDEYLTSPRALKDTDILKWWSEHQHIYPSLAKMARDFLSITATSVPSERLFSRAGLTIRKHRSRLNADSARCLLCINSWCTSEMYETIKENM